MFATTKAKKQEIEDMANDIIIHIQTLSAFLPVNILPVHTAQTSH